MRSAKRLLASGALVVTLGGCLHGWFYTGDGQLKDNGILAYSRRYVVDLGPIDLSRPKIYTYRLTGLPHATFNVAIHVSEETKNEWNARPDHPVVVRMQLKTASGDVVISEQSSLRSWTRGYGVLDNISELYVRGESKDVSYPNGNTGSIRLGVKASGGWGTYFDSERETTYLLELEILASSMNRPARLIVVGWDRT